MELKNVKWTDEQFFSMREDVLKQWPTGKDVNLQEALDYQRKIPRANRFSERLQDAAKAGKTLTQPRAGVALVDEHIKLLNYLLTEGEADLLPTTIDSYTRQNQYKEAQRGLEESAREGRSMLNGFAAVNHGVSNCRKVAEEVNAPLQIRHGTPDARLLAEISLAGGFTSYEGGGISYNIPYAKKVSMEQTIFDWQYCDRLIGIYAENGVTINREPFGPLTGTLVPPSISNAIAILEGLLAAEQGVADLTLGYGQCGNLIQDIAAIKALQEMSMEYFAKHGFEKCTLTTVLHQWMGGFPQDEAKSFAVISWGAATAALAGVTKVIVKTPHEALGIPTMEANAQGLRATKQMLNMLQDQKMVESQALADEIAMIKLETTCLLNKVFELGQGDYAVGTVRAFESGVLDVPFAPSRYCKNAMFPARDNQGAVRILNMGNLPFSKEIVDFHREKLEQRAKAEGRDASFQMTIDDVYAISNGFLVGKPRS